MTKLYEAPVAIASGGAPMVPRLQKTTGKALSVPLQIAKKRRA